jgi:hypothetical protein
MKAIPKKSAVPGDQVQAATAPDGELPGVLPARDGLQPVTDLNAFLQSLPDFGPDAVSLREAIAEDRELRRAIAEAAEC